MMEENQPTVAQAQERLDAIPAKRSELLTRREALEQRIGSTQQQSARQYLAGDFSAIEESGRFHGEIHTIEGALHLLDLDAEEAGRMLLEAKARELRGLAAGKRAELVALNAKTAELLEQVSALEDVPYTHGIELLLGLVPAGDRKAPLSRRLRMQIEELERGAVRLEQKLTAER